MQAHKPTVKYENKNESYIEKHFLTHQDASFIFPIFKNNTPTFRKSFRISMIRNTVSMSTPN